MGGGQPGVYEAKDIIELVARNDTDDAGVEDAKKTPWIPGQKFQQTLYSQWKPTLRSRKEAGAASSDSWQFALSESKEPQTWAAEEGARKAEKNPERRWQKQWKPKS